jgi:hypothetical protein
VVSGLVSMLATTVLLRGPTHEIPVPLVLGMRGDASELGSKDAGGGLGDMVTGALSKLLCVNAVNIMRLFLFGCTVPVSSAWKEAFVARHHAQRRVLPQ